MFDHLLCADVLSEHELVILKWGKNARVKGTPKRLTALNQQGTYKKATAMECLVRRPYLCQMLCFTWHFPFPLPLFLLESVSKLFCRNLSVVRILVLLHLELDNDCILAPKFACLIFYLMPYSLGVVESKDMYASRALESEKI